MNQNAHTNVYDNISNINFDEASEEWKKNKKSIGNGMYKYICQVVNTNKNICCKTVYKDSEFCWIHRNKNKNKSLT
jgi:hypothetical protein